jgi:hypothetical protein
LKGDNKMRTQYLNRLVVFVILFMMILIALLFAIVTESMAVAGQSLIIPTVAPVENCLNDHTMCINHIYVPLVLKGD